MCLFFILKFKMICLLYICFTSSFIIFVILYLTFYLHVAVLHSLCIWKFGSWCLFFLFAGIYSSSLSALLYLDALRLLKIKKRFLKHESVFIKLWNTLAAKSWRNEPIIGDLVCIRPSSSSFSVQATSMCQIILRVLVEAIMYRPQYRYWKTKVPVL